VNTDGLPFVLVEHSDDDAVEDMPGVEEARFSGNRMNWSSGALFVTAEVSFSDITSLMGVDDSFSTAELKFKRPFLEGEAHPSLGLSEPLPI